MFRKKLQVFAEKEYKQLARLFINKQYYMPPAIVAGVNYDAEDLTEENDPFGLQRDQIKAEMGLRLRTISKMEEDRPALFGVKWGLLSR